jgi:DNA-binding NtrC family response regulator
MENNTKHIAFIDDEPTMHALAKLVLKKEIRADVLNLKTFLNGQEFLDYLETEDSVIFDYVFSDINMPIMDGFDLLKNLNGKQYGFKFGFMTAYERDDYKEEAIRLGANFFLSKPLDWDKVREIIDIPSQKHILVQ